MTAEPEVRAREEEFALFLVLAAAAALALVSVIRHRPPEALGADAPADAFSAARAERVLRELVGDDVPHPLGSEAHDAVRDRVIAAFRAAGAAVSVETSFEHFRKDGFAHLANVVARVPGSEPGPPTLVLAHYDSVGAGPGAADDACSVAAMAETIRLLGARPPRHDVLFVATDGEEAGLLGAKAWKRAHRDETYRGVVNLEARGNRGPSLLFETGPGDLAAARAFGRRAARPFGASLFPPVYRAMPHGTDFTEFRDDHPGLNFACVGGGRHYHTPLDRAVNVDLRMLQHHGENAVAAIRAFDEEDVAADGPRGVWFTPFAATVVGWRLDRAGWGAGLVAALSLAAVVATLRRGALRGAGVAWAALAFAGGLAAAAAAGGAAAVALDRGVPFVAEPAWTMAAVACAALASAWSVHALLAKRHTPLAALVVAALGWSAGSVAVCVALPEASYLAVVPGCAAATAALAGALRGRASPALAAAPAVVSLPVLVPLCGPLLDALGLGWYAGAAAPLVLAGATTVTGMSGARRWSLPGAALVLAVAAGIGAARSPLTTPDAPGRLSLVHVAGIDRGGHRHEHVALDRHDDPAPIPSELAERTEDEAERMVPWEPRKARVVEVAETDLEVPGLANVTVQTSGDARRVRFRLVSRRGAPEVILAIDPKARLRRATVNGLMIPGEQLPRAAEGTGAYLVRCRTTPREGLDVELDLADPATIQVYAADVTAGLPDASLDLASRRPRDRVPSHRGDRTIVHRRLEL